MKMKVPHILIASRAVVLASGNAFAPKRLAHSLRQATGRAKKIAAEVVRDVQHVLVVAPRHHQAVAFYSSVMMRGNQGEHVGIHQDNSRFRSRQRKRLGNTAEGTFVTWRSVLHEDEPEAKTASLATISACRKSMNRRTRGG